jgi:hypothetical protein
MALSALAHPPEQAVQFTRVTIESSKEIILEDS